MRSTACAVALAAGVVAAAGAGAARLPDDALPRAERQASPLKVIDRRLWCTTAMRGGVHKLELTAVSGGAPGNVHQVNFELVTPFAPDATLVLVSSSGLQYSPRRCTAARPRPALTPRGLRGGTTPPTPQEIECETPRRVLVRFRAVFRSPTRLWVQRRFGYPIQVADGAVKEASLVVLTPAGRRLAFASIGGRTARLFAAGRCTEDDG